MIQWLCLRNLRLKVWRTVSTVLGLGVGASLFLTVVLINQSVLVSYREGIEALTGRAELIVTPEASPWMHEEALAKLEAIAVVEHATPSLQTLAKIRWGNSLKYEDVLNFVGIDLLDAYAVKNFSAGKVKSSLIAGDSIAFMNSASNILLSRDYAARNGLEIGDKLVASTPSGPKDLVIKGLLPEGGMAKAYGGAVAVMDIDAARLTFSLEKQTTRIDLFLTKTSGPDRSVHDAAVLIGGTLGPEFRVEEPAERVEHFQNSFRSFQSLIEFLGAVGLLVAWVLVAGTLQVSVSERQAEIGMLRALGTSQAQILWMILGESLALGLLGGALAVGASWIFGRAMLGTVMAALSAQALLKIPEPQLHLPLNQIFEFLAMTAMGAGSAGLLPAWRATRVSPLTALRKGQSGGAELTEGDFLGAAPLPFPSLMLQMAFQNIVRRFRRTATSVVLLAVALAFVAVIEVMTGSFEQTLSSRFDHSLTPDLVLIGQGKGRADQRQTLHESFVAELNKVPGVQGAYGQRLVPIRYEGREISLRSYDDMGKANGYRILEVVDRPREQAGLELYSSQDFTVLVSESFRNHFGKHTGDSITLATADGPVQARIVGITTDFTSANGAIYTNRAWYRKLWKDPLLSGIGVMVGKGVDTRQVQAAVRTRFAISRNIVVLSDREYHDEVMGVAAQAIAYIKCMRWAALLIAMIALFNSFMVDIRERWQELGVLRAVGMSPVQLSAMLAIEALLKAALAVALGLALGLGIARFGLHSYLSTELGWIFHLHFSWQAPVVCATLATVVSLLAVVVPTLKAISVEVGLALAEF